MTAPSPWMQGLRGLSSAGALLCAAQWVYLMILAYEQLVHPIAAISVAAVLALGFASETVRLWAGKAPMLETAALFCAAIAALLIAPYAAMGGPASGAAASVLCAPGSFVCQVQLHGVFLVHVLVAIVVTTIQVAGSERSRHAGDA